MLDTSRLVCAIALSSLLVSSPVAHAEDCQTRFWAAQSLEAYDNPHATVIRDLNGDGRADLAVSVFNGNQVRVFLAQANGTYSSQTYGTSQGVGFQPDKLIAGDVDGDGDVDLVVLNTFDRTFTVLKNNGSGLLTAAQTVTLGFSFGGIALGDMDGDGDLDLVAVGSASATREVQVFLNTAGSFAWSRDYAVSGTPGSVVLAQLDGDGRLDVAVAANDDNSVSVLWNGTGGILSAPQRLGTLASPGSLIAGDVDGDGRVDLLTPHSTLSQVGILANQGGRSFAAVRAVATGARTSIVALGDLDQDGDLDLLVTGDELTPIVDGASILLNSGFGTFTAGDRFDVGDGPAAMATGDLDGDGDLDVVVTVSGSNSVRLFTNRGGSVITARRTDLGGSAGVSGITHGDLDGDGRPDLIVAQQAQVKVLRAVGGAVFAAPVVHPAGTSVAGVAAGDVDGDGDADVVVVDGTTNDMALLRNNGGTLASPVRTPVCTSHASAVALEDMDGDGDRDAVVACYFDGALVVLRNNGAGAFAPWMGWGWGSSTNGPNAIAVGDLDGDGDRDVVVARDTSNSIAVLRNDGGSITQTWSDSGCANPESIALGDVNGDGRLDIVASCRLGAPVRVYINAGGGVFTLGDTPLVISPLGLKLADMDGDGDKDIVVVRGNTRTVAVLSNDGTGHFPTARDFAADQDPWLLDVFDWDADGDVDVATGGNVTRATTAVLNTTVGCPATASLSVTGGSVTEGNGGSTPLLFNVTLSSPVSWPVTVSYATANGTATNIGDYVAVDGTLTFAPGQTQKTIVLSVLGDTDLEPDETFWLVLSNAVGAPLLTAQAAGTILNDDVATTRPLNVQLESVEGGVGQVTTVPATYACTTSPNTINECVYDVTTGSSIELVAAAGADSAFLGWTGACAGTGPCIVSMLEARQVRAAFLGPRTLTVQVTGVEGGGGTLSMSPPPLGPPSAGFCDNAGGLATQVCTFQYPPGTVVTLSASAYFNSKFLAWSGGCSGTGPCQVPLSGPGPGPVVEASFLGPRTLTVQVTSVEGGGGTVSVSPAPLGPPGPSGCDNPGEFGTQVCTFQYPPDTVVTLPASAYFNSKFLGWSGGCSGTGACQVLLGGPGPGPFVEASFLGPRMLTLQLTSVEGGGGSVTVSPEPLGPPGSNGCDNPGEFGTQVCTFQYPPDTVVTLPASAYFNSKFLGWSGGCSGTGTCQILLGGPGPGPSVEASFLGPRTLTVQVTSVEDGGGAVTLSPAPLGPPGSTGCENPGGFGTQVCTFQYAPDTVVTLPASAYLNSKFLGWSGGCTGTDSCQVLLGGAGPGPFVDASFLGPRTLIVQVTSVEGGGGAVSFSPAPLGPPSPTGCDNPGAFPNQVCRLLYPPDTVVSVAPSAYAASTFTGWSGVCTGTEACHVLLGAPDRIAVLEASFRGPQALSLSIASSRGGRGSLSVDPPPPSGPSSCALEGASPAACTLLYAPGTAVTVTALPEPGSVLTSLAGCPPSGPCTITLSGPASVSAIFEVPNRAPSANAGGPYAGVRGQSIAFNGAGSGDPDGDALTYQWSFGDGGTATGVAPAHVFTTLGTFTVSLVVNDGQVSSAPATVSVVVSNRAPSANAGGPYAGVRGQSIAFNGAGSSDPDGDALTYQWSFGDGGTATGVAPSHVFTTLGTFTVSLVVNDGQVSSAPATASVVVSNLPPTVALTSPANGSVHPAAGPVALSADATDDGTVARVEFYAGAVKVGEDLSAPFTASWTGMTPGSYVLTARAVDETGASTTSASRTIQVSPPPAVTLTAPASGTVFVAPATLALAATATDDGSVSTVQFYSGTTLLGADTTAPYTFNWTGVAAGRYTITARAVDNVGGATVSAPITVDVVTTVAPAADSYVRDGGSASSNFGTSTALEVRVGTTGNTRWTYLRFDLSGVPSVQAGRLRLFGNLSATTTTAVRTQVFSSTNLTWGESSITWNNKPAAGSTVLASVPLVNSSTTARWYEWDLTAFLKAEKAAGHTAVTLVLKDDVSTTAIATFRSRQASSNRPELWITP
jgi:hypothetical protein